MKWPQIAWIVIMAMSAAIAIVKHGEPREGCHSFWTTVIAIVLETSLLYAGGFFG